MTNTIKIGVTERGDAALAIPVWQANLAKVDGAILITKNLTGPFIQACQELQQKGYPFILHCTCTGWGGSKLEPNVPDWRRQLHALKFMLDSFLPRERAVLRIDPIFPTPKGLDRVREVVKEAASLGILPGVRVRVSVYDEYPHVKDRLRAIGLSPVYGERDFQANQYQMADVHNLLNELGRQYGVVFETCAEIRLGSSPYIEQTGCVSAKDCAIMGLPVPDTGINPQNRTGCLCLGCKTELLRCPRRCAHQCIYCYWKS